MTPLAIRWIDRGAPLVPSAVVAFGDDARALARRVLQLGDEHRDRLSGSASDDLLIIRGAADDLPWTDGVRYLGFESGLLMPTNRRPDVPIDLFALAIAARFENQPHPLAIVESPRCVIPLGAERRIDADALRAWLERAS